MRGGRTKFPNWAKLRNSEGEGFDGITGDDGINERMDGRRGAGPNFQIGPNYKIKKGRD